MTKMTILSPFTLMSLDVPTNVPDILLDYETKKMKVTANINPPIDPNLATFDIVCGDTIAQNIRNDNKYFVLSDEVLP